MGTLESVLREPSLVLLRHLQDPSVSYAAARLRAQSDFKRFMDADLPVATNHAKVEEWLQPLHDAWQMERPPIDWYAGALTALLLFDSLPLSIARELLTAANYYGDSKLVHDLSARLSVGASLELRFEILKQSAKAYKNDGEFEQARSCYREALFEAHQAGARGFIAYFLLLYAKLCDHYEQRIAWHRAFHWIAHTRFKRLKYDDLDAERKELWIQISEDALARAIGETDPIHAQKYFEAALSRSKTVDDRYVRIASHFHDLRFIQCLSSSGPPDFDTLRTTMAELWRLRDLAYQLENERAINVRRLQYLRAARGIMERYPGLHVGAKLEFLEPLLDGEWRVEADDIRNSAHRLSDRRIAAMAAFETAKWRQMVATMPHDISQRRLSDAITDLETALRLLTESHDLMFDLYYSVVISLGELYEAERRWIDAERLYKDAYEYSRMIGKRIEQDDWTLSKHRAEVLPALPELRLLSKSERKRLSEELRHDYRLLLQRALTLCERIQRPQREQLLQATRRRIGRGAIQYHDIAREVRTLPNGQDPVVKGVLAKIEMLLNMWHKDELHEALTAVDVPRHIRHVVKSYPYVDTTELDGHSIEVEFDLEVLGVLVVGVIENVAEAAVRAGRPEYHIRLELAVRGGEVHLVVEDDTGDVDGLRRAVECINRGERPTSRRSSEGGYGLFTLRQYMVDTMRILLPWTVEERSLRRKALVIPLGRLLSDRKEPCAR